MRPKVAVFALLCGIWAVGAGQVGMIDTIGHTFSDYGTPGPALRMLVNAPGHGIHAIWYYQDTTNRQDWDTTANTRYNFYDYTTHQWWRDGVDVFAGSISLEGNVDADTDGAAVIAASSFRFEPGSHVCFVPLVARDIHVGAGVFEYAPGAPTLRYYAYPCIGINTNGYYQLAMEADRDFTPVAWSRMTQWPAWDTAEVLPSRFGYEAHNIATSKVPGSNKVCITWVDFDITGLRSDSGFYRESPNGGDNWYPATLLEHPPAFSPGSDTVPVFDETSIFPFYDKFDRLHIVANVSPRVRDTIYTMPSEIWHFCPDNTPQWTRIYRAEARVLLAPTAGHRPYACRPSIGEDRYGGLYVAWEQSDSFNFEPVTNRLRADIFYAQDNGDHGASWNPAVRITEQGTWSCLCPSAIDRFPDDTFRVLYTIDQQAGCYWSGEGAKPTDNPVVVQKVPVTVGIAEGRERTAIGRELSVWPNPFKDNVRISYELPAAGNVSLQVCDVAGRTVRTLVNGFQTAGRISIDWDSRDDLGRLVPRGVYILREEAQAAGFKLQAVRKLVVTR